jgi:hypothetical protein
MPFLPFVVLLAWQAFSKSASFALGWATAIYFGQVPGKQGSILAAVSLASAAWVILLLGFAVPLLAGAAMDAAGLIDRNFSVQPIHVLSLAAALILGPPAIAGATVWGDFHAERSARQWARMLPACYPATASLGLGVIQMVIFTPFLLVQRLVKKHALLQTAVSLRDDATDDDLVAVVRDALQHVGDDEVRADEAPPLLAWPMLTVGFAARHLVGAVVRGEPMQLRANGLQVFAYATNVAVLGPSTDAHRVRAELARELPFHNARVTWSDDAQEVEDAVMAAYRADEGADRLHRRLDEVQERLDVTDLAPDEWNLLYRLRLQVEHRVLERDGLLADEGQDGDAGDHHEGDEDDEKPRAPVHPPLGIGLVGPSAASGSPAHRPHSRRSRKGVVSA